MANSIATLNADISIGYANIEKQIEKVMSNGQKFADGHKIIIPMGTDEAAVRASLSKITEMTKDIGNIVFEFDNKALEAQMNQMQDFVGKNGKEIGNELRTSIEASMQKIDLDKLVKAKLPNAAANAKFNKTNATKLIASLEKETSSFNASDVSSVEQVKKQATAINELYTAKKKASELKFIDATEVSLIKDEKIALKALYEQTGKLFSKSAETWANEYKQAYLESKEITARIVDDIAKGKNGLGTGTGTGTGDGTGTGTGEKTSRKKIRGKFAKTSDREEQLTKDLFESKAAYKELDDLYQKMQKDLSILTEKQKELNAVTDPKILESADYKKLLADSDEVGKLTEQIGVLNTGLNTAKQNIVELENSLKSISLLGGTKKLVKLDGTEGEADKLINNLDTSKKYVTMLEGKLSSLSTKAEGLEATLSKVDNLSSLKEETQNQENQLKAIEEQKRVAQEALEEQKKIAQETIAMHQAEIAAIEEKKAAIKESISLSMQNEESLRRELSIAKENLLAYKSTHANLYEQAQKELASVNRTPDEVQKEKYKNKGAAYFGLAQEQAGKKLTISDSSGVDVTADMEARYKILQDFDVQYNDAIKTTVSANVAFDNSIKTIKKLEDEIKQLTKETNKYESEAKKMQKTIDKADDNIKKTQAAVAGVNALKEEVKENKKRVETKKEELTTAEKIAIAMEKAEAQKVKQADKTPKKVLTETLDSKTKQSISKKTPSKVEKGAVSEFDTNGEVQKGKYFIEAIVIPKISTDFKVKVKELLGAQNLKAPIEVVVKDAESAIATLSSEDQKINEVTASVNLLKKAFDDKTESIAKEAATVETMSNNEVSSIQSIITKVDLLKTAFADTKTSIDTQKADIVALGNVQENSITEIVNEVKKLNLAIAAIENITLNITGVNELSSLANLDVSKFEGINSGIGSMVANINNLKASLSPEIIKNLKLLKAELKGFDTQLKKLSDLGLKTTAFKALSSLSQSDIDKITKLGTALEDMSKAQAGIKAINSMKFSKTQIDLMREGSTELINIGEALKSIDGVSESVLQVNQLVKSLATLKGVVESVKEIRVTYTEDGKGKPKVKIETDASVAQEAKDVKALKTTYEDLKKTIKSIYDIRQRALNGAVTNEDEVSAPILLAKRLELEKSLEDIAARGVNVEEHKLLLYGQELDFIQKEENLKTAALNKEIALMKEQELLREKEAAKSKESVMKQNAIEANSAYVALRKNLNEIYQLQLKINTNPDSLASEEQVSVLMKEQVILLETLEKLKTKGIDINEQEADIEKYRLTLATQLAEKTLSTVKQRQTIEKKGTSLDNLYPEDYVNSEEITKAKAKVTDLYNSIEDIATLTKAEATTIINSMTDDLEALSKLTLNKNKTFVKGEGTLVDNEKVKASGIDTSTFQTSAVVSETEAIRDLLATISEGKVKIQGFTDSYNKLNYTVKTSNGMLQSMTATFNQHDGSVRTAMKSEKEWVSVAGKLANSFKTKLINMAQYISGIQLLMGAWNAIRDGVAVIRELDTAMTGLAKVSDESTESLIRFKNTAHEIAQSISSTTTAVIDAATEWTRLGYSIQEVGELAKATAVYVNVGGGLDSQTATQDIVSAMEAFKLQSTEAMGVVDKMNEVGNNYAASSEQLGEILQKSSSTLAVSGDSIDQVIAMGAAMNTIIQDASTTGSTLKVLSLRLRGAKTELIDSGESVDDMALSTSKLREKIKALTNTTGKGGFDIMADDKNFKTTYDIMKGISAEWENISNVDQAALLELIAGKNRAQGAAALVSNFATAEKALQSSLNSQGSALKENETYMKSIDGQLQILKSKWQEVWDNEEIKKSIIQVIKLGESLLDLVETLGLVKTGILAISTALTAFVGFKLLTGGALSKGIKSLLEFIVKAGGVKAAVSLASTSIKEFTVALKALGGAGVVNAIRGIGSAFLALPLPVLIVVAAITALVVAFKAVDTIQEKHVQKARDARKEYEASKEKLASLNDELKTTRERIIELENQGTLTLVEADELEKLKSTNTELERSIALEKELADTKEGESAKAYLDSYDDFKEQYKKDNKTKFDIEDTLSKAAALKSEKSFYGKEDPIERKALEETVQANKSEALTAAAEITAQIKAIDDAVAKGEVTLSGKKLAAYNAMKSDVKTIYDLALTESEKYSLLIQPVFDEKEFEGSYKKVLDYFIKGGSTDVSKLREKFGNDLIAALQGAGEDAGLTLEQIIEQMYTRATDFESTFAPIVSSPSGQVDAQNNAVSAEKRKFFSGLGATSKDAVINGEIVFTVDDSLADCQKKVDEFINGVENEDAAKLTITATLDTTKTDFSALNTAYNEFSSGKAVGADSINALSDKFGKLDNYTKFVDVLTNAKSTAEETQQAFNDLATEYINTSDLVKGLTQDNAAYTASQLELLGITNATEVVEGKLAEIYGTETQAANELVATSVALGNSKYNLASADKAVTTNSQGAIIKMIEEANAAGVTTVALQKLLLEKIKAQGLTLKTDGDVKNLIALAKAAGGSTATLIKYAQVKAAIARMGTYTGSGEADTRMLAALESQIKAEINAMLAGAGAATNSGGGGVNYSPPSSNTSGGGSGGGVSSAAATVNPEIFDWIEVVVNRLEEAITKLGKTVSNVYKVWSKRNSALGEELNKVKEEITVQQQAYDTYSQIASGVTLSEDFKAKIRSGQMTVESVSDEETKKQISNYEKWYGLAQKAKEAIDELTVSLSELAKQKFDNIGSEFEQQISLLDTQQSALDKSMSIVEAQGYKISKSFYENLISIEQGKQSQLKAELLGLQNALAESVNSGAIEQGSQAWIEMQNKISDVKIAIDDSTLSVINFNNEIRQLKWDAFDEMIDKMSQIKDESDFLIDLFSNDKLFSAGGEMTDAGQATLGLHAQNYNVYMTQAQKYAKEIKDIQASLAKDPNNQTLIERERELIEAQRGVISSAEDEKQAMIDLEAQGIQLQIDAMQELIDKKKESLDAEQSLYEYQKSIAEKTKAIATLQKQQTALSGKGADTEENRAKIQSIKLQLEEAKTDLAETERQKNIEDQKKMLDGFMTEYSDLMNAKLDDVQLLIKELIDRVNNNATTIANTIAESAKDSGYAISSELKDIWSTNGIENVVGVFNDGFTYYATSVQSLLQVIAKAITGQDTTGTETPTIGKKEVYKVGTDTRYTPQGDSAILRLFESKSVNPLDSSSYNASLEAVRASNELVSSSIESLGSNSQLATNSVQNDVNITLDMPNVTDYNSFVTQLQKDSRFENIIKAMTIDQLSGKSTLTKLKY